MKRMGTGLLLILVLVAASVSARAQNSAATQGTAGVNQTGGVPRLIKFAGTVTDSSGKPLQAPVELTFSLYEEQGGGAALWSETQQVQPEAQGHYSVLLGANSPGGLPLDLFTSGAARWLGVEAKLAYVAEQTRILLVGVPYALKAADADTLGGLPPSAFALVGPQAVSSIASPVAPSASSQSAEGPGLAQSQNATAAALSGCGTANTIAMFTGSSTIGNSLITQNGGAAIISEALQLPALGTATATTSFNSQPLDSLASAFNSSTLAAVSQRFRWQAEPVGNNTSSPSAKFNLLFASGSGTPVETGLSISSKGLFTFASKQTFPGTGTITGVTAGSGLTGGGSTGSVSLSLLKTCSTNQVLQWNGSAWVCATPSGGTITGVTAGTDLTGGGASGNVTLNLDTTKVPQLSGGNIFSGNQTVTGNLSASNQLISTVPQGTAPLQVTSTTQVGNLNASFLGGLSAGAFQPAGSYAGTGANSFSATQTVISGDVSLSGGNLDLPTTTGASVGVLNLGGIRFIHACCPNSMQNTFVGTNSGNFTADASSSNAGAGYNTAVGYVALVSLTSGYGNTATGAGALSSNTTGYQNTASGLSALASNNTGYNNTASGVRALVSNTTGHDNTASGLAALDSNNTGYDNTATGVAALSLNSAGHDNTATGFQALSLNNTAFFNTADGSQALSSNRTGTSNTASGFQALYLNTTGGNNTATGSQAGYGLLSGCGNILVGFQAGSNLTSNESNNIEIGNSGVVGDSGVIRIGTSGIQTAATFIAGIAGGLVDPTTASTVLIDSTGKLGTVSSSRRYKEDIHDMDAASDGLLRLRPVTFRYKKPAGGSKPLQYGLIAEEVAEVYPDLVVRGKDGQVETVQYYKLDAMLLNEVQKLAKAHSNDQAEIAALKSQLARLGSQVAMGQASLAGKNASRPRVRAAKAGAPTVKTLETSPANHPRRQKSTGVQK